MTLVPRAPPRRPPDRRTSGLLALLAIGAIGLGVASVLLLPAVGSGAPAGGPGTFAYETVTLSEVGDLFAVFAIGLVLLFLYMRFAGPGGTVPKRFLAVLLAYFLVSIAFIALVHLIGPGILPPSAGPATNSSQPGSPGSGLTNNSSLNDSTVPTPQYSGWFWVAIAAAAGVSVVGFLVAIWLLGRPAAGGPVGNRAARVETALTAALRSLDASEDPRAVLIRLYAELLTRIGGGLPELEAATPREIERASVETLGIPAGAAAELRELFEKARYSTLPLGAADVVRAREALTAALDSLQPSRVPTP